ncbi:MAG: hypothetical protein ACKO3K_16415 [Cuspidothrix sp.]
MQIKLCISAIMLSLIANISLPAFAQTPANSTIPKNRNQETEKINNIKKLLDITGSRNLSRVIINQLLNTLKTQYPQVPTKFWDTFMAELKPDDMIDEYIP